MKWKTQRISKCDTDRKIPCIIRDWTQIMADFVHWSKVEITLW